MDRYRRDPGILTVSALRFGDNEDDPDKPELDEVEDIEGYKIFDSRVGHTDDAWVAFSRDEAVAERIVQLLNMADGLDFAVVRELIDSAMLWSYPPTKEPT